MGRLRLTVKFEAPVHHGSGFGGGGLIDRMVRRDGGGVPYLGGSALKGKLRWAAGVLLRTQGQEVCSTDESCGAGAACALCRIFGSPRRAGLAYFASAHPETKAREVMKAWGRPTADGGRRWPLALPGVATRASTAISRVRGGVVKEHLFVSEVVEPLEFEGGIEGELEPADIELLKQAAQLLTHFGGGSSRGMGRCVFDLREEATE